MMVEATLTNMAEGELADLIDEFSDGKVMFAFVKVKDPNTSLPKYVLIGWCGEGVPERTKGYFTSYSNAVVKVLHVGLPRADAKADRMKRLMRFRGIMSKSPRDLTET